MGENELTDLQQYEKLKLKRSQLGKRISGELVSATLEEGKEVRYQYDEASKEIEKLRLKIEQACANNQTVLR